MKNLILMLMLVFSLIIVSATPVMNLQNSNPQPKETVLGTISTSGTFLEELKRDDITFYEGRKQVYFDYDLYYYDGTYYFYVVFNKEGDFTIRTKEILYNLAGEVGSKQIEKTVSVRYSSFDNETQTPTNLLEIKPPIVFSLANKSKITFFNRGSNDLSLSVNDVSLDIGAYQARAVNLNLVEPLTFLSVSTYKSFSIPVIYLKGKTPDNITVEENDTENETFIVESGLGVMPLEIEVNASENETITQVIYLENSGDYEITSVELMTDITQAKIDSPYSVESNTTGNITIQMFVGQESKNESILITYIENDVEFNISIPFVINILSVNSTEPVADEPSCEDYGGILCEEMCEGDSNFTYDGYCCYGDCVEFDSSTDEPVDDSSGSGWVIGVIIFLILAVIGYLVYSKYYKTKPKSPEEKIDVSKKHYENRLKGAVTRH